MTDVTMAIIAGGKSSRMGTDKSFVQIQGKPVIEHIVERVSELNPPEIILITNRPEAYKHLQLPMFTDVLPEKGSLGGIYTALHHSQYDYTQAVACDMPFVNPDLLRYMASLLDEQPYDVIVPRVDGYPQGLFAIYSKVCMPHVRERLDADRLKVIGFYDAVRVHYIDEDEYSPFDADGWSFYNVNTPDELKSAQDYMNKSDS